MLAKWSQELLKRKPNNSDNIIYLIIPIPYLFILIRANQANCAVFITFINLLLLKPCYLLKNFNSYNS
jgi:hypothetical protein